MISRAIELATLAHSHQKDKVGEPYIFHPIRVAMSLNTSMERVIAVLHDTVEDSELTLDEIESEFGVMVRDAVDCLTKRPDEKYMDYLNRVKSNPLALSVKIADIKDNSSPIRLYKLEPAKRIRLRAKYTDALNFLEAV